MNRRTVLILSSALLLPAFATAPAQGQMVMKTEHFDVNPGWDEHNNRAQNPPPRSITQNFGYSASTINAGGPAGEVGGLITPAGEPAYYAKSIAPLTFSD